MAEFKDGIPILIPSATHKGQNSSISNEMLFSLLFVNLVEWQFLRRLQMIFGLS